MTDGGGFPDPGQVTTQASPVRAPGGSSRPAPASLPGPGPGPGLDPYDSEARPGAVTARGLAAVAWPDPGQDDVARDGRG